METVTIGDSDGSADGARVFQGLSETLGTEHVAINYFECTFGDPIGLCYHRHREQEEVFYVISGTATFETEDGDVPVGAGEAIRFAPGEWQQGTNRGEDRLAVLALGAPCEEGPTDLRRECPSCGERKPAIEEVVNGKLVFSCEACGAETGRYS